MNKPMPLFVLASLLLHGLWLLVPTGPVQRPAIGGWQQALRVQVLQPTATTARPPAPASTTPPAPRGATRPVPPARHRATSLRTARTGAAVPPGRRAERPPARPAATPLATPDPATARARISEALRRRLAEQFDYPWLARRRGWEGQVTLAMRVENNGHLSNLRVLRTSGHHILDRSALESARRIGALPEIRGWLGGHGLDLQIPVRYRLVDS